MYTYSFIYIYIYNYLPYMNPRRHGYSRCLKSSLFILFTIYPPWSDGKTRLKLVGMFWCRYLQTCPSPFSECNAQWRYTHTPYDTPIISTYQHMNIYLVYLYLHEKNTPPKLPLPFVGFHMPYILLEHVEPRFSRISFSCLGVTLDGKDSMFFFVRRFL